MIGTIGAPSVCVVDDDDEDYVPILGALNELRIACVHFSGAISQLPKTPLRGVKVVFMDLHLAGHTGKTAASYAANAFGKIVHADSGPVLVVIWSKYADDVPSGNDETEAQAFQNALLESNALYRDRLIFVEMAKPVRDRRPAPSIWRKNLQRQIRHELSLRDGVKALWSWESMVREAQLSVSAELTRMAQAVDGSQSLDDKLKSTLRLLVHAQGEANLSEKTAPGYLATVLARLVSDRLENSGAQSKLKTYSPWLTVKPSVAIQRTMANRINSFLLTSEINDGSIAFMPGTVYMPTNKEHFKGLFGIDSRALSLEFKDGKRRTSGAPLTVAEQKWIRESQVVLLELSPACDVAQNERRNALLLAGVLVPAAAKVKKAESVLPFPAFYLRQSINGITDSVILALGSRYKVTMLQKAHPSWLKPLFQLRDLPTSAARNWHASHAARIGYVSM